LRGGLTLMLELYDVLGAFARTSKMLVKPFQRCSNRRVLIAQTQSKPDHKNGICAFSDPLLKKLNQLVGWKAVLFQYFISEGICFFPALSRRQNTRSDSSQIFDERKPKSYGNSPDLAYRKWRNNLIGADKPLEVIDIYSTISVRN
jgi:hypothetical protein